MKPQDVIDKVWELIDELCEPKNMSKEDYLEVLQGVRDDSKMRIETVEMELEDENDNE